MPYFIRIKVPIRIEVHSSIVRDDMDELYTIDEVEAAAGKLLRVEDIDGFEPDEDGAFFSLLGIEGAAVFKLPYGTWDYGSDPNSACLQQIHPTSSSCLSERGYFTLSEAALFTSLCEKSIKQAIDAGELPASDMGRKTRQSWRISRSDIADWMEGRKPERGPTEKERRERRKKWGLGGPAK